MGEPRVEARPGGWSPAVRGWIGRLVRCLDGQPRWALTVLTFALVLFVGAIDYLTGPEVSVSLFYLLPISLAAWYLGPRPSVAACLVSGATWLWAGVAGGHAYSHPLVSYWNAAVRLGLFAIVTAILVTLRATLDRQTELARTDALTGLENTRAFAAVAAQELERNHRYGHPLTIAYIDVDDFKGVNDRGGHSAGDALLRSVAATARSSLRATDVVARLGGDEFAILLPETPSEAARAAVEKVNAVLLAAAREAGWPVTFSIGVATFLRAPGTVDEMVRVADDLMYAAKASGKSRITYEVVAPAPVAD